MPTQRFYHIRPKKRAAIKDAIIRQLSEAPIENFSAKKLSEELDLSSGSFSGYFENRADMINYILQDYIDYEEKLFGRIFIGGGCPHKLTKKCADSSAHFL